jgi:hypothetical protein
VFFTHHARLRVQRAPGFPCTLCFSRRRNMHNPGARAPREGGGAYLAVIRAFDERRVQGGQSHASVPASPRSPQMTIFWHCGLPALSSKTASETHFRQPTVNGFGRGCCSKGSGNADSQRFVRSSGGSGDGRSCPGDSGCVRAHPADWRASASYRPLRAVWAVCAWALRGCARSPEPFSAQECSARP